MNGSHHILSVLVENKFGVLSRIAGLFSRRGYNIYSLAVSPTEDERYSRMTVVVDGESAPIAQVTELASIFEAKILDVGYEAMTLMVAGAPEKLDAMTDLLAPYQIVELQRTGRIALAKLSRESSKLKLVKTKGA